jgi:hypothetical protein
MRLEPQSELDHRQMADEPCKRWGRALVTGSAVNVVNREYLETFSVSSRRMICLQNVVSSLIVFRVCVDVRWSEGEGKSDGQPHPERPGVVGVAGRNFHIGGRSHH